MTKKMMRNIVKKVKMFTVLFGFASAISACYNYETHYTRDAIVIEINDDVVTVVDTDDFIWKFEGNGFSVNDEVILFMNTMSTDSNIFDDEIEDVRIVKDAD